MVIYSIFFSNSNTKERIKVLMEKQENLETSIHSLIEKNFEKIDTKFDKSSSENKNNLFQIQERISLIDRAQQNINHLTENVVDLKNFCQIQVKEDDLERYFSKTLLKIHYLRSIMTFKKPYLIIHVLTV